jgi:hypothetical protein
MQENRVPDAQNESAPDGGEPPGALLQTRRWSRLRLIYRLKSIPITFWPSPTSTGSGAGGTRG